MMKNINRKQTFRMVTEWKSLMLYIIPLAVVTLVCAFSFLIFDPVTYSALVEENSVVEWLTFIFLFLASIFFLLGFFKYRNIYFLLLSLIFIFGAFEEISWGQRVFGFDTPEMIRERNVQQELNLHNLEVFNSSTFQGDEKSFLMKLLDANNIFKIFALLYCFFVPLLLYVFEPLNEFLKKIRLPVPPLAIGIFIFINLCILYFHKFFINPGPTANITNYYTEMWEMMGSMTFLTASVYFLIGNDRANQTAKQKSD